jgi:uncharacterized protein (TIGR02145 family)
MKKRITLISAFFVFSFGLSLSAQFLRMPLPFVQEYSTHPASVFFDKGSGFQLGFAQQAILGEENKADKPYEASFNFKHVFTGSLKKASTKKKKFFFPGFSLSLSQFDNGGIYEGFASQAAMGARFKLGSKTNDFFSLATALMVRQELARIESRTDFYVVDINDPVFLSANNAPNNYSMGRLSSMLNKRLGDYTYLQMQSTFDVDINASGLGLQRNFNGLLRFLWPQKTNNKKSFVLNEWQPGSYSSIGSGFSYYSDYGMFLTPQFDFMLGLKDYQSERGVFNWRSFRMGVLISLKLMNTKMWDGIQVSLKYDWSNRDRRRKMKCEKNEGAVSYYQPLGPLHLASNTTGIFFMGNSERLLQDCAIQMRIIEGRCPVSSDINVCKDFLDFITKSREEFPCLDEAEYNERLKSFENQMNTIINRNKKAELNIVRINDRDWVSKNLQLELGSFASNQSEWIELCNQGKPAYCYVNFDAKLKDVGFIYNKYVAVNFKALAGLQGYHISTTDDWQNMLSPIDRTSFAQWSILKSKWFVMCLISPGYIHPVGCKDFTHNGFNYRHASYFKETSGCFVSGNTSGAYWLVEPKNELRSVKLHASLFACENFRNEDVESDGYFIRLVKDK